MTPISIRFITVATFPCEIKGNEIGAASGIPRLKDIYMITWIQKVIIIDLVKKIIK